MKEPMRNDGYFPNPLGGGPNTTDNRYLGLDEHKSTSEYSPPPASHDTAHGTIEDHYGGKKLGMTRTALIFFTNQVGIGILSLPGMLHTIGLIPGIFTIIILGVIATYTAYILIQFYRQYPSIRDIVDVAKIMGGLPLQIIVGIANVLNLCLICASANVTLSIGFNTISNHALCTVGFIGLPMVACWLLCVPRTMNFAGWFGIPATISIRKSQLLLSQTGSSS
jgi:hypothetical protein